MLRYDTYVRMYRPTCVGVAAGCVIAETEKYDSLFLR